MAIDDRRTSTGPRIDPGGVRLPAICVRVLHALPFPRSLVYCLAVHSLAFAQPVTHRIEYADNQTIQASIGYEIRTVNFMVTRWTAFLPEPPELPSQVKVKTFAEPAKNTRLPFQKSRH